MVKVEQRHRDQQPNEARLEILSERGQQPLPYRVDVYCSNGWQHCASFGGRTDAFEYGERFVGVSGARVWKEGKCIAVNYGPCPLSWRKPQHLRNCNGDPCECGEVPPLGSMALPTYGGTEK